MHRDDSYAATSAGSAASDDERDLIVCGTTSSARAARDMFVKKGAVRNPCRSKLC